MPSTKPVQITLYHAKWCGHCVKFMPTWEAMKSNPKNLKTLILAQVSELFGHMLRHPVGSKGRFINWHSRRSRFL